MIVLWEIHIESKDSLSTILEKMKTKGLSVGFELGELGHYSKLWVKHPQTGDTHKFQFHLVEKEDEVHEYELGACSEKGFEFLLKIAEDM